MPFPVNATVCAPPTASSNIVKLPLLAPATTGANVRRIVQVTPAFTVAPQLFVALKGAVAETLLI
jgi:hypothetical protein